MRVNLVTEGTYPHFHGGVSVWTDQLVRGLAEHEFEVTAFTGTGNESQSWAYPDNVSHRTTVPLWPPVREDARPSRAARRRFAAAWEVIVVSFLGGEVPAEERDEAWQELCHPAVGRFASGLVAGREAARSAVHQFHRARTHDQIPPSVPDPALIEILEALDHVSAAFRSLAVEPAQVDMSHAVSNGLAAIPCLINYWADGTPFVVSEHGVYLRERLLALRPGATSPASRVILQGLSREVSTLAYRHAALLAPGNRYNRRWEERLGCAPERIQTTYNGVDAREFDVVPEPVEPTLVFAGRIDPIKDVETLLRAFADVSSTLPHSRLRVFGPTPKGNEEYALRCRRLADELGIAGSVTFEGRVDRIGDAYDAAQVVVLPSISEGFPFTVIEAMCAGRPVVATDVGGTAEAVGSTGFVVPPRNPSAMAAACLELLCNDDLRGRLGRAARERVLANFTIDVAMETMRRVYERTSRADLAGTAALPAQVPSARVPVVSVA